MSLIRSTAVKIKILTGAGHVDPAFLFDRIVSVRAEKNPGFFIVHIGSGDGVGGDPLRRYVIKYGWSGVFVEPVKYLFEKLVKNYSFAKGLLFENSAVSEKEGFRDFYYLRETNDPISSCRDKLGSFYLSHVLKHKKRIPDIEKYIVSEKVRTITYEGLIKKYAADRIDMLLIDAEGYDHKILESAVPGPVKPSMVLFEHAHLSHDDYRSSRDLLKENGYDVLTIGINTFACRRLSFLERVRIAV